MIINITARKTIVKDSFKEKVDKKLAKFDRFFGDEASASVTVTNEQGRETVEVTIRYKGMIYRTEKTTEDRAVSLDAVCEVLMKQIVKNKNKLDKKVRSDAFVALEEEYDGPEDTIRIAKIKKFPLKPMSPEEAVLQMNLLDHQFFMFHNALSGEINVVYARNNGDYGLIEPSSDEDDDE